MPETYSDSVMGYLDEVAEGHLTLRGIDGALLRLELNSRTNVQRLRNLGESAADATADLFAGRVEKNSLILAYGPVVPYESGTRHYANTITVVGAIQGNPLMTQGWWITQITEIANFYRKAQFGDGPIDFAVYRTNLGRGGEKLDGRQETAVLSRLIYGMATSFMLTGNEDHLAVAKNGCEYMVEKMLKHLPHEGTLTTARWWLHGLDVTADGVREIEASDFADDLNSIPAYEQIYALAGLTQTYRVTGDPAIFDAIRATLVLFDFFYKDNSQSWGGYFSHIDPRTFSAESSALGKNMAKKNWNSNGDHAPAYLFNLYLATGDQWHLQLLKETFDVIINHFPQTGLHTRVEETPFVQERFNADWTPDETWGWQQDRAVVGHNLKIAWNLTRMSSLWDNSRLLGYATRIAHTMPRFGLDIRRGGWYDVLERELFVTDRFSWHDRKAWWQQEQAILAYLILAAKIDPLYENEAFEAAAFYNANFLDHDFGGVFPTVLASGMPYVIGGEGGKGSHAMGMYHAGELCYLAASYCAFLRHETMQLWFKPVSGHSFQDKVLRIAPDAIPAGRLPGDPAHISMVLVNGELYDNYDRDALTVTLPDSDTDLTVQVSLTFPQTPPQHPVADFPDVHG